MQKPDWANWGLRVNAALWEAIALSLDADPIQVARIYRNRFRVKVDHPIEKEFRARIAVLADNFVGAGWKRFPEISYNRDFLVADLASFIVSTGWPIPNGMVALAHAKELRDNLVPVSPATTTWTSARKQELLDEHDRLTKAKHKSPTAELAKINSVSETTIRKRLSQARTLKSSAPPAAKPATPFDLLFPK